MFNRTAIATYLTQMFPNRVGKVIIDGERSLNGKVLELISAIGVLEPYSYSNKVPMDGLETDVETAEQALIKWIELCVANPDKCSIAAKGNNTAEGVHKLIEHLLDVAYQNYDGTKWDMILDNSNMTIMSNPRKWTFSIVAAQLHGGLYDPSFGSMTNNLIEWILMDQSIINGTATSSLKRESAPVVPLKRLLPYSPYSPFATNLYPANVLNMIVMAIFCGDSVDYQGRTTEELFQKFVKVSQTVSRNFGSMLTTRSFCHRWTPRSVERLPKKMNVKPKNVVLVIGNTEDPITPYSSARTLASSAHLANKARLVKYHVFGHGSGK
jgi:hypothetical protein